MKYTHQHWKSFNCNVRPDRMDYAGGKNAMTTSKNKCCASLRGFFTCMPLELQMSMKATHCQWACAWAACVHIHTDSLRHYVLWSTVSVSKLCSLSQKSSETLLSECHSPVWALIKANDVNFGRNCCVVMHDETVRKLFQLAPLCILK